MSTPAPSVADLRAAFEPVSAWCEHRHPNEPPSCGAPGIFLVSMGTRRHDAGVACRRHLAQAVEALECGTGRPVTVTRIIDGRIAEPLQVTRS
jgi:hypothetical protein